MNKRGYAPVIKLDDLGMPGQNPQGTLRGHPPHQTKEEAVTAVRDQSGFDLRSGEIGSK
jgi:hypothetical protein